MNVYLYSFRCKTWLGESGGLRNVYTDKQMSDDDIIKQAKEHSEKISWSKDCDISLILKYKQSIESVFTYPNIAKIQHESFLQHDKDNPLFK